MAMPEEDHPLEQRALGAEHPLQPPANHGLDVELVLASLVVLAVFGRDRDRLEAILNLVNRLEVEQAGDSLRERDVLITMKGHGGGQLRLGCPEARPPVEMG